MKEYTIIFPLDTKEGVEQKINIIRGLIGEDNLSYHDDIYECTIPELMIRCDKKTWKEIKFKLGLSKMYW